MVLWNSIVAAYVQGVDTKNALRMFGRMTANTIIFLGAVSIVNALQSVL